MALENVRQRIEEPDFWRELCPALEVDSSRLWGPVIELPSKPVEAARKRLRHEGYFRLEGVFEVGELQPLAEAVLQVVEAVEYPVFALVYDEFWRLVWRLQGLLGQVLGAELRILPDIWAWKLDASSEAKGWAPHRDRDHGTVDPDGNPRVVSLWLPLTDATPENGCIYVVPAPLDPDYSRTNPKGHSSVQNLQDIRAVPAAAGDLLCWSHQLLHWGGRSCAYATQPRISVAFELQRSDVPGYSKPLLRLDALPDFSMRLGLIGRQLLQYQHMVSLPKAREALARRLHKRLPQERSFAGVLGRLLKKKKDLHG